MSFLSINSAAEHLVREWQRFYAHSPRITVAITLIVLIAAGFLAYVTEQQAANHREAKRLESASYATQSQKLEDTKINLHALLQFVEDEKSRLAASEQALRSLKQEHEQLRPLVESNRKTIDAIFSAQESRNQTAQITERWIGFAMGVFSSLVASFIWAIISYVRRRGRAAA